MAKDIFGRVGCRCHSRCDGRSCDNHDHTKCVHLGSNVFPTVLDIITLPRPSGKALYLVGKFCNKSVTIETLLEVARALRSEFQRPTPNIQRSIVLVELDVERLAFAFS
jgi:hypothetical protein